MKYLKKYHLFLEEVDAEKTEEGSDDVQESPVDPKMDPEVKNDYLKKILKKAEQLEYFKQKRTTIENIFKDPKIVTDAQLSKELLIKIYGNKKIASEQEDLFKYLKRYEEILRSERRKNKLTTSIKNDEKKIIKIKNDTQEQISYLNAQKTDADKQELAKIDAEIANLQATADSDIESIKDTLTKNKTILNRDKKINWTIKREDYKKDILTEIEKTKSLIAKLQK